VRTAVIVLLVVAAALGVRWYGCEPEPAQWRAATFNIEHFPKDQRQIDGAFAELATLGAGIIAVQEITDTELFAATARERLGADWQFVPEHAPDGSFDHQIGVLFDRRAFTLVGKRVHDGTRLGGRHKPTLDVELRDRATDEALRVLVVHFKSGGEHHPTRHQQFRALRTIVTEVSRAGAPVILLGDFNATGDGDRADLAGLAAATRTTWATEGLACSAFWDRLDTCPTSRLDHALTSEKPIDVRAAGACATVGCDTKDRCPLYEEHVSDHCPVVVTFER
jgi:endonuclease/exonuclease/phosphatase family metal-dependent hydrolase